MLIGKPCVVSLTWILQDTLGETLDILDDPVDFFVGGDDLFVKIEEALDGKGEGDVIHVQLEPEDAFGDFDESLIFLESRAIFPSELQEGMALEGYALPKACNPAAPKDLIYTVSEIYPEHIVLDGNHPLAGIALRLTLKVRGVRKATTQETELATAGTGFFKVQPKGGPREGTSTIH